MKITWKTDIPKAEYSSRTGKDEQGNRYHEDAAGERVTCTTPDGRTGTGWTPDEALMEAVQSAANVPESWTMCPAKTEGDFLLIVDGSRAIATIHSPNRFGYSRETAEAVARKIAACPDLLEAIEALLKCDIQDNGEQMAAACIDMARAAIARAKP